MFWRKHWEGRMSFSWRHEGKLCVKVSMFQAIQTVLVKRVMVKEKENRLSSGLICITILPHIRNIERIADGTGLSKQRGKGWLRTV
jgi:hypothetical protein